MKRCVLLLYLFAAPLTAQQRTPSDYALAGLSTALIVADWSQTLQIAANPLRYREFNPLLGGHPSIGRVNTICALGVIANVAALRLPTTPRRIWYVAVLLIEGYAVSANLSSGLRIGF
jgi:hypothetical protein